MGLTVYYINKKRVIRTVEATLTGTVYSCDIDEENFIFGLMLDNKRVTTDQDLTALESYACTLDGKPITCENRDFTKPIRTLSIDESLFFLLVEAGGCDGDVLTVDKYNLLTSNVLKLGGVSNEIPDKVTLASHFNFTVDDIELFEIIGSDVMAKITLATYTGDGALPSTVTYIEEKSGALTSIATQHQLNLKSWKVYGVTVASWLFYSCQNLEEIEIPALTLLSNNGFRLINSATNRVDLDIPLLTSVTVNYPFRASYFGEIKMLGLLSSTGLTWYEANIETLDIRNLTQFNADPSIDTQAFANSIVNTIYANIVLQTNNAGGVDATLQTAINNGATIVYV